MNTKERPIIFNGEMVRAILEGRKTQTRRPIKVQPPADARWFAEGERIGPSPDGDPVLAEDRRKWHYENEDGFYVPFCSCPYGQPGDRLWVRETWFAEKDYDEWAPSCFGGGGHKIWFSAGGDEPESGERGKTRPSIHMPRWASRIDLEITNVRVERVQDISEEDARAEGIIDGGCLSCGNSEPCGCDDPRPDARDAFCYLWNSIYEDRGIGWLMNPWVWVIEFEVVGDASNQA